MFRRIMSSSILFICKGKISLSCESEVVGVDVLVVVGVEREYLSFR